MSKHPDKPLRTSEEVFHRFRWDPAYDAATLVIGYQTREAGLKEVPLPEFVPGGDIPWHRVYYFRRGDEVLWDRRSRLDRVFGSGEPDAEPGPLARPAKPKPPPKKPARPRPQAAPAGPELEPLPLFRFDGSDWAEAAPAAAPASAALTALTWNVKGDERDEPTPEDLARFPLLLAAMRAADADLIALQEVTPEFLALLLAEPWVRERYWATDSPAAATVHPYGPLLLSRLPLSRAARLRFSTSKHALWTELRLGARTLVVPVLHLTSDRAERAEEKRLEQAKVVRELLARRERELGDAASLVLGDLNADEDTALGEGFVDAWALLRPGEPGATYDPERNTLAARESRSGRPRRLDRVLARPAEALAPTAIALWGEGEPPASDHFGLRCTLELRAGARRWPAPVHRSALVLLPPESVWPPIQAIRAQHDKQLERWMPHVNLLYGFVPEEHFDAAARAADAALESAEPFPVTLAGFGAFAHRASATLWLRPDGEVEPLQARLQAAFPNCDEQNREGRFTAHLSVGQFPDATSALATAAALQAGWAPLRFDADEVCLISRREEQPFAVRRRVRLAGLARAVAAAEPAPGDAAERRAAAWAAVEAACAKAAWGGPRANVLHALGSERLGLGGEGDLDVVCLGPASLSREAFFAAASAALGGRAAADAVAPVLRLELHGVPVDLAYARLPEGVAPEEPELLAVVRDAFDAESWRALSGCLEAEALRSAGGAGLGAEAFRLLLRALRAWSRARGLRSNAWGYLGGYSWAVLAAHGARRGGGAGAALEALFAELAGHPWPEPIALTDAARAWAPSGARDRMPVLSLVEPVVNSARNVTAATLRVLTAELARAAELAGRARSGRGRWDELFAPYAIEGERLRVSLTAPDPAALAACKGWVEGHALGLVLELEGAAEGVRPDGRFRGGAWELALSNADAARARRAAEAFVARFEAWEGKPTGARLEAGLVRS